MGASYKTKTFTAASASIANGLALDFPSDANVAAVFANSDHVSATPTIQAVLVDGVDVTLAAGTPIKVISGTVTPTARRDNVTNAASGNYVCNVAFDVPGEVAHKFDLLGHRPPSAKWYLICTDIGAATSLVVKVDFTTKV